MNTGTSESTPESVIDAHVTVTGVPRKTYSRMARLVKRLDAGRSNLYSMINAGTLPPGIVLSPRVTIYDDAEFDVAINARGAGATEDELRVLVTKIVAARKVAP